MLPSSLELSGLSEHSCLAVEHVLAKTEVVLAGRLPAFIWNFQHPPTHADDSKIKLEQTIVLHPLIPVSDL